MKKYISLILFIVAVIVIGAVIGTLFAPGAWYTTIQKPSFTPPNGVFAPVWTVLYIMIAVTGWRTFILHNVSSVRTLWLVQMVLNFIWMPIFFGAQMPLFALISLIALIVCVFVFILIALKSDKVSSLLFVPYLAWLMVALYLNTGVVLLN